MGPLSFDEIFKPKPWGGRAMSRVAGKRLPPGEPIGESWEVADHPHGTSVVAGGPLAGKTLRELMRKHGRSLLGRASRGARFPLLVKVLDAKELLSVQVHPDDRCARRMRLKDPGKTEAWYVLEVRSHGRMVTGLRSKQDIPRLRGLAESGALGTRLQITRPRQGEALLCPAPAVHGLGPGIVVLEIQQNSDATFRLYDWGRVGLDGKPRALHVKEGMRAIGDRMVRVRRQRSRRVSGMPFSATRLVSCEKFVVDRWRVPRAVRREKAEQFEILHVTRGSGILRDPEWPDIRLRRGRTVLVPSCVRAYAVRPRGALEIIRAAEPE